MVAGALRPGMTDREKAIALWRLQTTHRFHASTGDAEVNDPVKVFNVYGYTTCGNDSICLAGLWKTAGFKVRPARCVGHCISQVNFDGRWNLLDGDMGPFYLLRDNATIAGEQDLVRDHDLLKRTHTHGILDPDSRADAEWSAALFVSEGEAGGRPQQRPRHDHEHGAAAATRRWCGAGATGCRSSTTAAPTSTDLGPRRAARADLQRPVGISPGLHPGSLAPRGRHGGKHPA